MLQLSVFSRLAHSSLEAIVSMMGADPKAIREQSRIRTHGDMMIRCVIDAALDPHTECISILHKDPTLSDFVENQLGAIWVNPGRRLSAKHWAAINAADPDHPEAYAREILAKARKLWHALPAGPAGSGILRVESGSQTPGQFSAGLSS